MNKSKFFIYGFLFVLVCGIILMSLTGHKYEPQQRVEKIIFENNKHIPSEDILKYCMLNDKKITSELSSEIIMDRISKYPLIKNVLVEYSDSITLKVYIEEEEPVYFLLLNNENYVITKSKKVIKNNWKWNITDLPVITGLFSNSTISYNLEITNKIDYAFFISSILKESNSLIYNLLSEINFASKDNIELYFTTPKAKMIVGKDFSHRTAANLSKFWKDVILTREGVDYAFIDCRFQDLIVTKEMNFKQDIE